MGKALTEFTLSPEHLGFKVIGILPALVEHIVGPTLVLPAMFFSLFSTLNLYLIYGLARRVGSSSKEALYAMLFASSCLSLLYYARHLFPYDMAMSFGLLALYLALTQNKSARTSAMCGIWGFLCFITYNGYWSLAAFAMLVNIFMDGKRRTEIFQKAIFTAIGFITPLVLLIIGMLLAGKDMISAYRLFAASITQGSFEEGWSFPFAYFWHTEHGVILILGALSLVAIVRQFNRPSPATTLWAAGFLFLYLCLVIPSVLLHSFVVYGRLARQLIPFVVLLSAQGLVLIENRVVSGRLVAMLILLSVFTQAAWNFVDSYNLNYPREFVAEDQRSSPDSNFHPNGWHLVRLSSVKTTAMLWRTPSIM